MLARALLCLVAFLAGADALRLPAAPHARRHAPVRMDGTQDRIKEMIEQNKCAQKTPPRHASQMRTRRSRLFSL